ncbi:MAG: mechanosensitive ion channel [Clostridiales bacterium]|nr:mechanosensitive ion channel [Candidatus Equinaster intestinalis]
METVNGVKNATTGFGRIIGDVVEFFTSNYWNIFLFAVVFIAGIVVIKLLLKLIKAAMNKASTDGIMQQFVLTVAKCVFGIIFVLLLFNVAGIELGGIVTAFAAVVLAVGVALQNYISNIASGIIIACSKLYKKGDYVIVNGVEGHIEKINILFTTLHTYENKKVIIPNSKITSESVVNVFSENIRRVNFHFNVAYDSDVELVKKIVTDTILSDPRVKKEPAPFCGLYKLDASSLDFAGTCFCDTEDYWKVHFFVTEQVYNEFKRNGITVPYQQTEVRLRTDEVTMPVITQEAKIRGAQVAKQEENEKDFSRRGISEK